MADLYAKLLKKFDRNIVDICLALYAKRAGIPTESFEPMRFCEVIERVGTAENIAKINMGIEYFDNMPGDKSLIVGIIKDILREHNMQSPMGADYELTEEDFYSINKELVVKKNTDHNSIEIWNLMNLPNKEREIVEEYFYAIIKSCQSKGLVLSVEHGLFVCVPKVYLHINPMLNQKRKQSLLAIERFDVFLEQFKAHVDNFAESVGQTPSADYYREILMGQLNSMVKESGSALKIREIDVKYGLA